ncbi:hypothetical protein ml_433 [Mollivirus sibericum]|uniref:hypothetical protein n=1 Tax=Mollivirus sibericum TaxID=1678078 RepID=UPI0006B2E281|nr:hypothetical protein ml_433 [Mollivirus sibericum]ALD62235.1 hypothetical protein ml_433 [Mollivirus sibericum]
MQRLASKVHGACLFKQDQGQPLSLSVCLSLGVASCVLRGDPGAHNMDLNLDDYRRRAARRFVRRPTFSSASASTSATATTMAPAPAPSVVVAPPVVAAVRPPVVATGAAAPETNATQRQAQQQRLYPALITQYRPAAAVVVPPQVITTTATATAATTTTATPPVIRSQGARPTTTIETRQVRQRTNEPRATASAGSVLPAIAATATTGPPALSTTQVYLGQALAVPSPTGVQPQSPYVNSRLLGLLRTAWPQTSLPDLFNFVVEGATVLAARGALSPYVDLADLTFDEIMLYMYVRRQAASASGPDSTADVVEVLEQLQTFETVRSHAIQSQRASYVAERVASTRNCRYTSQLESLASDALRSCLFQLFTLQAVAQSPEPNMAPRQILSVSPVALLCLALNGRLNDASLVEAGLSRCAQSHGILSSPLLADAVATAREQQRTVADIINAEACSHYFSNAVSAFDPLPHPLAVAIAGCIFMSFASTLTSTRTVLQLVANLPGQSLAERSSHVITAMSPRSIPNIRWLKRTSLREALDWAIDLSLADYLDNPTIKRAGDDGRRYAVVGDELALLVPPTSITRYGADRLQWPDRSPAAARAYASTVLQRGTLGRTSAANERAIAGLVSDCITHGGCVDYATANGVPDDTELFEILNPPPPPAPPGTVPVQRPPPSAQQLQAQMGLFAESSTWRQQVFVDGLVTQVAIPWEVQEALASMSVESVPAADRVTPAMLAAYLVRFRREPAQALLFEHVSKLPLIYPSLTEVIDEAIGDYEANLEPPEPLAPGVLDARHTQRIASVLEDIRRQGHYDLPQIVIYLARWLSMLSTWASVVASTRSSLPAVYKGALASVDGRRAAGEDVFMQYDITSLQTDESGHGNDPILAAALARGARRLYYLCPASAARGPLNLVEAADRLVSQRRNALEKAQADAETVREVAEAPEGQMRSILERSEAYASTVRDLIAAPASQRREIMERAGWEAETIRQLVQASMRQLRSLSDKANADATVVRQLVNAPASQRLGALQKAQADVRTVQMALERDDPYRERVFSDHYGGMTLDIRNPRAWTVVPADVVAQAIQARWAIQSYDPTLSVARPMHPLPPAIPFASLPGVLPMGEFVEFITSSIADRVAPYVSHDLTRQTPLVAPRPAMPYNPYARWTTELLGFCSIKRRALVSYRPPALENIECSALWHGILLDYDSAHAEHTADASADTPRYQTPTHMLIRPVAPFLGAGLVESVRTDQVFPAGFAPPDTLDVLTQRNLGLYNRGHVVRQYYVNAWIGEAIAAFVRDASVPDTNGIKARVARLRLSVAPKSVLRLGDARISWLSTRTADEARKDRDTIYKPSTPEWEDCLERYVADFATQPIAVWDMRSLSMDELATLLTYAINLPSTRSILLSSPTGAPATSANGATGEYALYSATPPADQTPSTYGVEDRYNRHLAATRLVDMWRAATEYNRSKAALVEPLQNASAQQEQQRLALLNLTREGIRASACAATSQSALIRMHPYAAPSVDHMLSLDIGEEASSDEFARLMAPLPDYDDERSVNNCLPVGVSVLITSLINGIREPATSLEQYVTETAERKEAFLRFFAPPVAVEGAAVDNYEDVDVAVTAMLIGLRVRWDYIAFGIPSGDENREVFLARFGVSLSAFLANRWSVLFSALPNFATTQPRPFGNLFYPPALIPGESGTRQSVANLLDQARNAQGNPIPAESRQAWADATYRNIAAVRAARDVTTGTDLGLSMQQARAAVLADPTGSRLIRDVKRWRTNAAKPWYDAYSYGLTTSPQPYGSTTYLAKRRWEISGDAEFARAVGLTARSLLPPNLGSVDGSGATGLIHPDLVLRSLPLTGLAYSLWTQWFRERMIKPAKRQDEQARLERIITDALAVNTRSAFGVQLRSTDSATRYRTLGDLLTAATTDPSAPAGPDRTPATSWWWVRFARALYRAVAEPASLPLTQYRCEEPSDPLMVSLRSLVLAWTPAYPFVLWHPEQLTDAGRERVFNMVLETLAYNINDEAIAASPLVDRIPRRRDPDAAAA